MTCPYFVPREIVYDISWPHPTRLPLGAGWTGSCCASGNASTANSHPLAADENAPGLSREAALDSSLLRDFCNLGYATKCPNLPHDRDWDAIRFSVASSSREQITVFYVCEKSHEPAAHGSLTFNLMAETWRDAYVDPRVRRLANSYLHAYRARQSGAPADSL